MIWALTGIGGAAIVAAFLVTESPADARKRRIDERRVDDLQRLSAAIDLHHSRTGALPASTLELQTTSTSNVARKDPESGAEYEYRALDGASRYELCAVFSLDDAMRTGPVDFWSHGAGRTCFAFTPRDVRRRVSVGMLDLDAEAASR